MCGIIRNILAMCVQQLKILAHHGKPSFLLECICIHAKLLFAFPVYVL